jgi:hypothetical protein
MTLGLVEAREFFTRFPRPWRIGALTRHGLATVLADDATVAVVVADAEVAQVIVDSVNGYTPRATRHRWELPSRSGDDPERCGLCGDRETSPIHRAEGTWP